MRVKVTQSIVLIALIVATGCAARGVRNQTRVGALTVGEASLALDQAERQMYASNTYNKEVHDQLGAGVLKVLYAARGFERAAVEWPEDGSPAPQKVLAARSAALAALADFEKIVPAVGNAREPLLRALAAIRAAMESQS